MSGIIPSANSRSAAQWPPQSPGQKPYPEMAKVPDNKPLLQSMGATGVAIFSGIITSEEYNSDFFWRDGIKIYEQMLRSDGQIRAIRTVLENPIKRATWSIEPGSESPRDKEIASFVDSCLFHDMRYTTADGRTRTQSWAQIVHHILMHLWYGFIPFEINWRVEDGWVKWAKWEPLLPRTVWRWWVGRDTELVGIQQWTFKDYNYAFVDIPADKLLLFVHQQEGANFEGLSLLRTAYKHWWYKSNFEKIEAIGLERNAVVPPVISLPENFTAADVAAAQTLGANMRASELGYATLPPGWMLEYPKGMQPFTSQVQPAIQYHDVMIARNVLAQFINLGSTETGAFALADAQQQMFLEALEAVTDYICDVINADAIRRLVDYNYDNVEVYPQLRASRLANADITKVAEALGHLKAREANFINPGPEMEDYLREQMGFPKAPVSVVQSTNPTAESAPERPENANANDHSDQESNAKQTQRPDPAATADTTAANNAIAPAAPGDGGALSEASERSEALDEVRLLREAIGAIVGLDAVDRAMQFIDYNHQPAGAPNGGQFAPSNGGEGGEGGESEHAAKGGSGRGAAKGKGAGGASKAPKETIHERSARLQKEGNLPAEQGTTHASRPPKAEDVLRSNLQPIRHEEGREINPSATPDARMMARVYGEHQLGASLALHTNGQLRQTAEEEGLSTSGGRAALISRITSHVTEGRYSANFGKSEEAPKAARSSGRAKAEKTEEQQSVERLGKLRQREADLVTKDRELEAEFNHHMDRSINAPTVGGGHADATYAIYHIGDQRTKVNNQLRQVRGRIRGEETRLEAARSAARGGTPRPAVSGRASMTPEAHAAKAATLKAALDKAQAAYDAHMAKAPKLSERSVHDEEGRRLLAEVQRAQAALEALSSDDGK